MNKMYLKPVFAFFLCLLFSFSLQAQIPKLISYQGLLADDGGVALTDGDYSITVNLYDAAQGGVPLWSETRTVTLAGGLFNVLLGEITPLDLPFDKMYYLATSIGGIELSPRTPMAASPYALNSAGGGGKAYALDSEDGSKPDVVYVNAAGKVGIGGPPSENGFTLVNGDETSRIGLEVKNNFMGIAPAGSVGLMGVGRDNNIPLTNEPFNAFRKGVYSEAFSDNPFSALGVFGIASGSRISIGVRGIASGSNDNSGVYATAVGGSTNYGIYAKTDGGENDYAVYGRNREGDPNVPGWAGYFDGRGKFGQNLRPDQYKFATLYVDGLSSDRRGIVVKNNNTGSTPIGIEASAEASNSGIGGYLSGGNIGIYARTSNENGLSGWFVGKARIDDTRSSNLADNLKENYGLDIDGASNGIAISLKDGESTGTGTDGKQAFIGFFDSNGGSYLLKGSIRGVTSLDEVDLFNCLGDYFLGLLEPGEGAGSTSSNVGPSSTQTGNWAGNEDADQSARIEGSKNDNALDRILALECGPINFSSLYEIISKTIEVVKGGIAFTSSFFSLPFDGEDIWSQGLALFSAGWDLGTYLDYIATFDGVSYETSNGDYSEYLIRADSTEAISRGEIVGVRAGEISKSFIEAEHFMAISTAPAMSGAMPHPKSAHLYEQVAFLGQVPVKVGGVVHKGDYIVPSGKGDGFGIAVSPDKMLAKDFHRIVGIAWDESDGKEVYKMINTAVGINQNDLANMVDQLQSVVNSLQVAMNKLDPSYEVNLLATSGGVFANNPTTNKLDYTVADTHPSKVQGLFDGARFETEEETIAAVKQAWKEVAHIDVEENEMVRYILENRDKTEEIVEYYSGVLTHLQSMQQSIVSQLQEGK